MYRSVEEARQQWCPQAMGAYQTKFYSEDSAMIVANRVHDGTGMRSCRCLATDCAWWRPMPSDPRNFGCCGAINP